MRGTNQEPGMTLTVGELSGTDPAVWAREREERKKEKQDAAGRLKSSFVPPNSFQVALSSMQEPIRAMAQGFGVPPPEFDRMWDELHAEKDPKKIEQGIRKKVNESFKLISDKKHRFEFLALCVLHARFLVENKSPAWKVGPNIKRLVAQLKHSDALPASIGFIRSLADEVGATAPETAALCRELADEAFLWWQTEIESKAWYESSLAGLPAQKSTDDKHFTLNALIEYLDKRRKYNPAIRETLISLCEDDIKLYRAFLKNYSEDAPNMASFYALWGLYAEEGDKSQLLRLQKIAQKIGYGYYDIDEELPA